MAVEVGTQSTMRTQSTTTNKVVTRTNGVEVKEDVTVINRAGTKTYIDSNGDEANGKEWKEDVSTTKTTNDL